MVEGAVRVKRLEAFGDLVQITRVGERALGPR